MASTVSSSAGVTEPSYKMPRGVAPLRAGSGRLFLLRRLHSLSGIVPVGAFLVEHFISNSFATNGPHAYASQVKFLTSMPFLIFLETFGIFIPILYHALYGFYIWYQGESNVGDYPWIGNWMYTAQRWTGAIAFVYIIQHTWYLRFSGVHLVTSPGASFGKVQHELQNPVMLAVYVVAIIAASWHLAYGIWLFAAKWGFTPGDKARKRFGVVCFGIAALFITIGLFTVRAFFNPEWANTPTDYNSSKAIESGEREHPTAETPKE